MTETKTMAPASSVEVRVPSDFLKPSEVASRLRASRAALYEWLARGDLPCYRLGRAIRVREADLADFLARRRVVPVATRPYGRHP
jgi:excisionase family DNA binding protein